MNQRNHDYKYAGIIFMHGNQVLACLQRKWQKIGSDWIENRFISGFGGAKNEGETSSLRTAIRETLEEIYEFIEVPTLDFNIEKYESGKVYYIKKYTIIPENLLDTIQRNISFIGPFEDDDYHLYKLNYNDLKTILSIVNEYLVTNLPLLVSIAYRKNLPENINDLISFPRQDLNQIIEILQIYNLNIDGDELRNKELNNKVRSKKFEISKNFSKNIDRMKPIMLKPVKTSLKNNKQYHEAVNKLVNLKL
jgi:RNAse (barnase) inhibitor barstar